MNVSTPANHYPTGMVFGVFDALHEGHRFFLAGARTQCDKLVVVVTLPKIVLALKKKLPRKSLEQRMADIQQFDPTLTVIPGDSILGEWGVLRAHTPDMIFLGYDQHGIAAELRRLGRSFVSLPSFRPETYKTSLLP